MTNTNQIDIDTEFLIYPDWESGLLRVQVVTVSMIRDDGRTFHALVPGWKAAVEYAAVNNLWQYHHVFRDEVLFANGFEPASYGTMAELKNDIFEFCGSGQKSFWAYVQGMDKVLIDHCIGSLAAAPKDWPYTCLDLAVPLRMLGIDKDVEFPRDCVGEHVVHNSLSDVIWQRRMRQTIEKKCACRLETDSIPAAVAAYMSHSPR